MGEHKQLASISHHLTALTIGIQTSAAPKKSHGEHYTSKTKPGKPKK
jgi:hypothetical protein